MLDTEQRQNVTYFVGTEVEHTICYGMVTLFIVGTPPLEEILEKLESNSIAHAYFGTSQSFPDIGVNDSEEWKKWDAVIIPLLEKGYWVTLDLDIRQVEGLIESCYCEHDRFVPMISAKIPYIRQLNYNATLKIDDKTWGKTNSGVWSIPLHTLMQRQFYTHWDQYLNDTEVK
jgi:hypothetical protein